MSNVKLRYSYHKSNVHRTWNECKTAAYLCKNYVVKQLIISSPVYEQIRNINPNLRNKTNVHRTWNECKTGPLLLQNSITFLKTQEMKRFSGNPLLYLQWYCSILHSFPFGLWQLQVCFTLDIRFMYAGLWYRCGNAQCDCYEECNWIFHAMIGLYGVYLMPIV